jgi:TolB-like protein/class 3 adenylate cyclase/tetratricopeptide (TPR) repeat protein
VASEHRLAAVLMADVVSYSRLMAEDEDATVRTVTAYREEIELHVRQHRGRLVDFTGDAFLAEFPSALYAVQCGVEVQRLLGVMNAALPAERQMQFRMGVHLAEVRAEGDRLFGTGVNIAARLEGLADAGGLFISSKVYDEVQSKLDLDYEDLGKHKVKNLPDPVRVYRVKLEAAPPLGWPRWMRGVAVAVGLVVVLGVFALQGWRWLAEPGAVAAGEIGSIAVLPLANLSGDPEQEYVADGMTEALIGELAKLSALRVISRTSVMQYKDAPKPIPEIAEELDVDAVIEGAVIRENDRIRITAQLIDARNDRHLWNDRYDREMSGVLALQSDVARAVAEQIRLELTPEEQVSLAASRRIDPQAYDAYLRGLQLRGPQFLIGTWGQQAITQFERAVKRDPDFAEAHAALAQVRLVLAIGSYDSRIHGEFTKARAAASRALELHDRLASAYVTLAWINLTYEWDFSGARRAFEQGIQFGPSDPTALVGYASYLLYLKGSIEEMLTVAERLLHVAPFDLYYRRIRLRLFSNAGEHQRVLEETARLQELDPDFVSPFVAETYFMLGRYEEAHRNYIEFYEKCGTPCDWERKARERGWAEGGWEGSVRAWLDAATQKEGYSPVMIVGRYQELNEIDRAMEWFERAYSEHDPMVFILKEHAYCRPLRSDPRFDDLLRRIGFPEN